MVSTKQLGTGRNWRVVWNTDAKFMQYLGTGGKWSHDLDGITKEENRVKKEESLNLKPGELPVFVE